MLQGPFCSFLFVDIRPFGSDVTDLYLQRDFSRLDTYIWDYVNVCRLNLDLGMQLLDYDAGFNSLDAVVLLGANMNSLAIDVRLVCMLHGFNVGV